MSWSTPTVADLVASLSEGERAKLAAAATASGQEVDAQLIARTCAMVRGYVRRSGVALGAAGTIPPELVAPAMDIAAVDALLRADLRPSEQRMQRRRDAYELLRDMAAGRGMQVSGPDEDPLAAAIPAPSIESIDRSRGRDYSDGIL